jgi:acetoin utilization protein AcuB
MLVNQIMSKDVVTVAPTDSLGRADDLLIHGRFRHLPVLDGKQVVGIVSDRDIRVPLFLNDRETALRVMDEKQIREIMRHPVLTASPLMTVEQAAAIMHDNKIGCLPVVDEDRLVGIVSESDIFRVFVQMMGVLTPSSRVQLQLDDRPGQLADVTRIIKELQVNIVSIVTEPGDRPGKRMIMMRLQTMDPIPAIHALQKVGIEVVSPQAG